MLVFSRSFTLYRVHCRCHHSDYTTTPTTTTDIWIYPSSDSLTTFTFPRILLYLYSRE